MNYHLNNSKIFLVCCLAFIFGVYLGRFVNYEIMAVTAMVFVIITTLGLAHRPALIIGLAGLMMVLGGWRFLSDFHQNDLAQFYDQKIQAEGMVLEEPDERSDKTFLTVGHVRMGSQELNSKILLHVKKFPEYKYGQKIFFEGKLLEPKDAETSGEFSYKNYLSRFGIDGLMYYPEIELRGQEGWKIKSGILGFKTKWVATLGQILPEPQNAFLGGLILGIKRSIPEDLAEAFRITGTSHIVAVSGYNITIIAVGIDWLLRGLFRRRASFLLTLLAIAVFVLMTGASASVVRAGLMGALLLTAWNIGRLYAINNALAFAALIMLLISPQILHFDIGFQLSFAALLGLVYIHPRLEPYFGLVPKYARQFLVATLAAQIATLPILLLNFGQLSLAAPIANLLVLPVIPLTMLFGFLSGLTALAWLDLAWPFASIAWLLLSYIIWVIRLLASLPWASVTIGFSTFWFAIYYVILLLILTSHSWRQRLKSF